MWRLLSASVATPYGAQPATAKSIGTRHARPFGDFAAIDERSNIIATQSGVDAIEPLLFRDWVPHRLLLYAHDSLLRLHLMLLLVSMIWMCDGRIRCLLRCLISRSSMMVDMRVRVGVLMCHSIGVWIWGRWRWRGVHRV